MLTALRHRVRSAATALLGRSLDIAGGSGRWPASSSLPAPVLETLAARARASQRAGYLAESSTYGAAFVEAMTVNLVGDGPSLRSTHPDAAMRATLEASWTRFYRRCDVEGLGDLGGFLRRVARCWAISGEAFVLLSVEAGSHRLTLRLLSPEQVQTGLNYELPSGNRIVAGIEIDPAGRRVAYHILPNAPDGVFAAPLGTVRVAGEDVCHVFEPWFPGQIRGLSLMAPLATRLLEVDKLEDALLARFNTSALFAGFVTDPDGTAGFGAGGAAVAEMSLEPGVMRVLPVGATVQFPNVPDAAGAPDFLRHMIRSVAAGGSIPYELISGDLSQVNYSSARLGLEQFKRRIKALQSGLFVAQLIEPVWERLITLEVLTGRLAAPDFEQHPDDYLGCGVMWPAWASLDPQKETQADILAMQANVRSRFEVISARGRDPQEVDAEIKADTLRPPAPTVVTETIRDEV